MNVKYSLIWELMFYKFKLDHNAVEATKDICCAKVEDTVDHCIVTRWFKKFCLGCKNVDQVRSGLTKTVDSKAVLLAIEASLVSSSWRVSGEFSILLSSVVCYLHHLGCQIVPRVIKTFNSS